MPKFLLIVFFAFITNLAYCQASKQLSQKGDSLYTAKSYLPAAALYEKAAALADFKILKRNNYYNAACCYSLAGKTDSAFILLNNAIANGYSDVAHMKEDADLNPLHNLPGWQKIVSVKTPQRDAEDPYKAQFITTDVQHFWNAYDLAQKDTANRYDIYKKYYLDLASPGMQDYVGFKLSSWKQFVKMHDKKPRFYASIRGNTAKVETQKKQMQQSFVNFKNIYPAARFPNIYFIIGAYTSAGTSTEQGLLIGLDQAVRSPDVQMGELSLWERNNISDIDKLPNLIAHELIHYEQKGMANDSTLLKGVLVEGMADFIGELISGDGANSRLMVWTKGKEKKVWADFKKEMYLNRSSNWIANSDQETVDKPADLGYWVGYQICKAYYKNSPDKKKAINDMLHIKNYRQFYADSKVEDESFLQ